VCAADFYMSLYNVIFTVLPPLVIGIFDQDVDREMSRLYPGQPLQRTLSHLSVALQTEIAAFPVYPMPYDSCSRLP